MLSQENRKKIVPNGLYKREIDRAIAYANDPYWCTNWTFVPVINDDEVVMIDSYYQSYQNSVRYYLDDDNIDDFELILNFDDVRKVRPAEHEQYADEDRYCVACDSGGRTYPKYFVKKDAMPVKERQIEWLDRRIDGLKASLKHLEEEKARIIDEEDQK